MDFETGKSGIDNYTIREFAGGKSFRLYKEDNQYMKTDEDNYILGALFNN